MTQLLGSPGTPGAFFHSLVWCSERQRKPCVGRVVMTRPSLAGVMTSPDERWVALLRSRAPPARRGKRRDQGLLGQKAPTEPGACREGKHRPGGVEPTHDVHFP